MKLKLWKKKNKRTRTLLIHRKENIELKKSIEELEKED